MFHVCCTGLLPRSSLCTLRGAGYGIHAEPEQFRVYKVLCVCVCVCVMRLFAYKRLRNASLYFCWPRNVCFAAVFVKSTRVHLPLFPVFCVKFLVFRLRHCHCNLDTVCRRSDLVISHLRQQSFVSCISSEMCVCVCVCVCVHARGSSET